ncbi:MAG: hypothetical protein VX589_03830 [Myxococcota bacterium]|nr:hypothetical protein [Myxococcota bacterium]
MGLFGSGVLRRQIDELAQQLEGARRDLETEKAKSADLHAQLAVEENNVKTARDGRKKAEKKLERLHASRTSADQKATSSQERVAFLEQELSTYQTELLKVKNSLDKARAELAKHQEVEPEVVEDAPTAETSSPAPEAVATPSRPRTDRRVERLEDLLAQEKDHKNTLKDRLNRAEKGQRDAEKRRVSELNRAEAVLRDLRHSLRSERRAYKVLQMQFEAVRLRALEGLPFEEPALPELPATTDAPAAGPVVVVSVTEDVDEVEAPVTDAGAEAAMPSVNEGSDSAAEGTVETAKTEPTHPEGDAQSEDEATGSDNAASDG